jgi:hypothetical protein
MFSTEIVASLYFDNSLKTKLFDDQSKPRMELSIFCDEDDIDESTRRNITYQIHACRLDVMVVYRDTLARLGHPITGYTASIFEKARFQPHILHNLFHGISIIKCNNKLSNRSPSVAEIERFTKRINIVAPYRSSLPMRFDEPDSDWEPSLGDHGWVMVGTREYVKRGGTISNRDMCLVVYTTMDNAVMNQFELLAQEAYESNLTMKQVENKLLVVFRAYTIENRKRLLHRFNKHVTNDLLGQSVRSTKQINSTLIKQSTANVLDCMEIPDYKDLPATFNIYIYVDPNKKRNEEEQQEEDFVVDGFSHYNYTLDPESDIIFSDITPSTEMQQYVIRSNCCKIDNEVIRLEGGPCDIIHMYNVPDNCQSLKWLDSFPCIGTGKNKLQYDDDYFSLAGLKRNVLNMSDQGQVVHECISERDEKYRIIPKMAVFDKSQIN